MSCASFDRMTECRARDRRLSVRFHQLKLYDAIIEIIPILIRDDLSGSILSLLSRLSTEESVPSAPSVPSVPAKKNLGTHHAVQGAYFLFWDRWDGSDRWDRSPVDRRDRSDRIDHDRSYRIRMGMISIIAS